MMPLSVRLGDGARGVIARQLVAADALARRCRTKIDLGSDFAASVDSSLGEWACWPWAGSRTPHGYSSIRVWHQGLGVAANAHRAAYYRATGFWHWGQSGYVIRHLCHNPACCNPRHLLVGTRGENAWDDYMRQMGVDLVAIRRELERGPFQARAGVAQ